tara:strand:- start:193 stop:792 length:600 start_codon:yes stop_codon:yes gene_type:complete
MKIGNIISEEHIKVNNLFSISKSINDLNIEIPTLVIGIDNIEKLNIKFSYIDRKINETLFWTFSKKEKRTLFEEDLFYFLEYCYNNIKKSKEYVFIDLITNDKSYLIKTFDTINNSSNIVSYLHDDMLYILINDNILGFNTNQLKFMKKNINKFLTNIRKWSTIFLTKDEIYLKYKNKLNMFNDEVKYIPLIYSLTNTE